MFEEYNIYVSEVVLRECELSLLVVCSLINGYMFQCRIFATSLQKHTAFYLKGRITLKPHHYEQTKSCSSSTWVVLIYREDCSGEQRSARLQSPAGSCSWDPAASDGMSSVLKPDECSFLPWPRRRTTCNADMCYSYCISYWVVLLHSIMIYLKVSRVQFGFPNPSESSSTSKSSRSFPLRSSSFR